MKLPRDLSGTEVARRLARHYGYYGIVTCGSARCTRSSPMWRRSSACPSRQ